MQQVLIGIDLGTTNLKAAAFAAESGRLLARASVRLPTRVQADGGREQDVTSLRDELLKAMHGLRRELGTHAFAQVQGLGVAAQGGSGAVVEKADGHPLTPLYLWNDSRCHGLMPQVAGRRSAAYWRDLSQRENPGTGLARMLWLEENTPGILGAGRLYAGAGELAFHALTGVWRQDPCNALQMGCYRVLEERLDADPLSVVGVDLDRVAPLRQGHRTAPLAAAFAAQSGLPAGVPVAGPYMDHEAGYLSSAHLSARQLQVSLGTAWVGNFSVPSPASGWCPFQLVIPSPTLDGRALVIQPLLTGNVSWDWAVAELVGGDASTALARADALFQEQLLPPLGVVCIPWLTQQNPFVAGMPGGGGFFGVAPHVTRGDLVRALAAGMCFEFRRVFSKVVAAGAIDCIVLGGGASRGPGFQRLLSCLFAPLPLHVVSEDGEAGARGSLSRFGSRAGRVGCAPLPLPSASEAASVAVAYELYCRVFAEVCGSHPLAAPYALR